MISSPETFFRGDEVEEIDEEELCAVCEAKPVMIKVESHLPSSSTRRIAQHQKLSDRGAAVRVPVCGAACLLRCTENRYDKQIPDENSLEFESVCQLQEDSLEERVTG